MTTPTNQRSLSEADTRGLNVIPFASMAGGWLGPLLMFWLYVWGPLRPFHYPPGPLAPSLFWFLIAVAACFLLAWAPASYFKVHAFERRGRVYEWLGVRWFRAFVPDGDFANRWRRRSEPAFRIIRNREGAAAFVRRTEMSEKSHAVLLAMGMLSVVYALHIGWKGWALYLGIGNVLVNLYPVLLQRYTRTRLHAILSRSA